MILPYCSSKCQQNVKDSVYSQVMEDTGRYDLSPEWKDILTSKKLDAFRMDFNPLDIVGDPAFHFKEFQEKEQEFPLSWMSNMIEQNLTRPHFIVGGVDFRKEV